MRPEKGTPEWDLWIAAIEVAVDPPWKRGATVSNAGVWWPKIEALRDALEACDIDWQTVKRTRDS